MSRLDKIKNEVAKELGYTNYSDLFDRRNITNSVVDMVSERYAKEVAIASLEKADKAFKNTAAKSIGTALKYFEESDNNTVYKRDVIALLHAFHQFESQGLSIVGMGYKRYDGKEITDLSGAYEGGYFTEEKKYTITNPENIVML